MPTPFDDVEDLALMSFKDWELDALYNNEETTKFQTLLDGWLIKSIPSFTNCKTNLTYTLASRQLDNTLSDSEKTILSNLIVLTWMDSQIFDVRQMSLHLNDTDFKMYSEAQNLTAKVNAQVMLREKISQDMVDYGFKNVPWQEWAEGNFFGT